VPLFLHGLLHILTDAVPAAESGVLEGGKDLEGVLLGLLGGHVLARPVGDRSAPHHPTPQQSGKDEGARSRENSHLCIAGGM
jgi:hypothetical protein